MDILLLHGWNQALVTSAKWYKPLISLLEKKGHRVFAPDLPGFGLENPPDRPYSLIDYANWVKRFVQKNKLHNPLIIGHSFGGRVSITFSEKYPHITDRIVLTGVPGHPPVANGKVAFFKTVAKVGGQLFSLPIVSLASEIVRKP